MNPNSLLPSRVDSEEQTHGKNFLKKKIQKMLEIFISLCHFEIKGANWQSYYNMFLYHLREPGWLSRLSM